MKRILKKLIFIMVMVLFLKQSLRGIFPKVYALDAINDDVIVIDKKVNIISYLETNGYEIIETNIDTNKTGDYLIKCMKQGITYIKKIIVKEEDDYFCSNKSSTEVTTGKADNAVIKSTYETEDTVYVLYDKYYSNDGVTKISTAIKGVKNNQNTDYYILYTSTKQDFKDILIDKDNNVVLYCGSVGNSLNSNEEAVFGAIPYKEFESKKYFMRELDGDKEERFNTICKAHNYYYFGGYTKSTTGIFENTKRTTKDPIIILVNPDTFEIQTIKTFDNDFKLTKDEEIVKIINYDNYLYCLMKIDQYEYSMLKIDYFGNLIDKKDYKGFLYAKDLKMAVFNEKLYLLLEAYDYKMQQRTQTLYEVLNDCTLKKKDVYAVKDTKAVDFRINELEEITYLVMDNAQSSYYLEQRSIKGLAVNINYQTDVVSGVTEAAFASLKSNQVFKVVTSNNIGLDYVKTLLKKPSGDIWINDEKTTPSKLFGEEVNEKLFGEYFAAYIYQENNSEPKFFYITEKATLILPQFGIKDGEEYDLNLQLFFNGEALLNNMKIEQGHRITEEGEYTITLKGHKGLISEAKFKVLSLSVPINKDETTPKNKVDAKVIENAETHDIIKANCTLQNQKNTRSHKLTWLYVVPLGVLVLSIIIAFRKDYTK